MMVMQPRHPRLGAQTEVEVGTLGQKQRFSQAAAKGKPPVKHIHLRGVWSCGLRARPCWYAQCLVVLSRCPLHCASITWLRSCRAGDVT